MCISLEMCNEIIQKTSLVLTLHELGITVSLSKGTVLFVLYDVPGFVLVFNIFHVFLSF